MRENRLWLTLIGKVIGAKISSGAVCIEDGQLCPMPLNSDFQKADEIKHPSEAEITGSVVSGFGNF